MSKILKIETLNINSSLNYPSGLCYDNTNRSLYITDMQNQRVIKFHDNLITQLPSSCNKEREYLKKPLAITCSSNKLIITDAVHNCLFTYENGYWKELCTVNELEQNYNLPSSITMDDNSNIYFSDFHNNRICKINARNEISVISEVKGLKMPYGIHYHDHMLYITDTDNNQIMWFDTEDKEYGVLVKSTFRPIAVTSDQDCDIYISDNRKLFLYQKRKKQLELIVDAKMWREWGLGKLCHIGALVSIDENQLILSDTIKNKVYKLFIKKN